MTIGGDGLPLYNQDENIVKIAKDAIKVCTSVDVLDQDLRTVFRFGYHHRLVGVEFLSSSVMTGIKSKILT